MMNRDEARRMAHDLVSQMTLEEKASQLRFDSPAIERLGIPAYNWWNEALHGAARTGTATVFPQSMIKSRRAISFLRFSTITATLTSYATQQSTSIFSGFLTPN